MSKINPIMKYNLLLRILIVGTTFLIGSCSNAETALEPINCATRYDELVSEIKSNANRQNLESPYSEELIGTVAELLPLCPNNTGLRILMANIQTSLGKNITALVYATEALHLEPDNAEATHTKGMILSLEGKTDESLTLLEKSLELAPGNLNFQINYCSTLESVGHYKEAIAICSQAIKSERVPPVVFFIRGRSYDAMGQKDKARIDYDKAKALGFVRQ
jgi:tetratricopeptide (TPR) repeat protein